MTRLLQNLIPLSVFILGISISFVSLASEPMDDVFELLDTKGGTRTGINSRDGYYVVAISFSSRSNENKALEDARIKALRQLSDMINGVTMSGSSHSSIEFASVSDNDHTSEFSSETFTDVVNTHFKGQLSAAKQLKSGQYDGDYFVAIIITQTDSAQISSLRSSSASSPSSSQTIIITTDHNSSVAQTNSQEKTVESKGLASMKHGEAQARKQALIDAIRNAVQQAQGVMMQGKSGKFNDAISLAISTKTEGYVSNYDLIDEDIERGQYYVIINATVNASKLLNDVNFYTQVLGQPIFSLTSENNTKTSWLIDELERLGFAINDGTTTATHHFSLSQSQRQVENHKGLKGVETSLSINLKDSATGDILFTVNNSPLKSRIYVQPESRAAQVSEHSAYKQMKKKMGIEIIQALARHAEKGVVYQIVLNNAKRTDVDIFKHVLNNGTSGQVETWEWDKDGKQMTLNFRFSGPLSEAIDQSLNEIYATFKKEGKGRRPHMTSVEQKSAHFDLIKR
ncbi:hypothetical protein HWQ46_05590 [Shewanella sp. D64]|uniref:hypothetical protein n=1 Tax=unclassified Shewanella TaxID=196818 RepID=UPI0022BA518E|nr:MULTISPECIES: hypothetical protein [unclassified Shewanella]MEC4725025.1 hypothetical protein [Shewanella sp. D64]MEC4736926.1 hypothetical protein [Shewanella sp. E94]WBJ96521.1 hypothetical protein HWQ47_05195 [Shewanella sp. MTB7]